MKKNPGFSVEFVPEPWGEHISTHKKSRKLAPLDVVVLLLNVIKGAQKSSVGFEDADRTYKQMLEQLGRPGTKILVNESLIESALWSCNLLDEQGEFEHPSGTKFGPWLRKLLKPDGFDRLRNYIKHRKEK